MSQLQTNPGGVSIGTTDYPLIEVDMSSILAAGETITGVAVRLQTSDYTALVTLPDSPTFVGSSVFQLVKGSLLTVGTIYRLIWIITL